MEHVWEPQALLQFCLWPLGEPNTAGSAPRTATFDDAYQGALEGLGLEFRVDALCLPSCIDQGVFLWTLRVCTLGFWVPKPWNMALDKGIWDPKLRGTSIKGTNLKSLN